MQGLWMSMLTHEQIEAVAAFATYPVVPLMTVVKTLQGNLNTLAARRNGNCDELPHAQATMAEFKRVIGFEAIEQKQASYELAA